MNRLHLLEEAYQRFLSIEEEEWGEGKLAAIQRYTWATWYRPSLLQFSRLVAEYVLEPQACSGGVPRLHHKLQSALGSQWNKIAPPIPVVSTSRVSDVRLKADPRRGQIVCDIASRTRVAQVVQRDFPYGAKIALLGDDDLVCGVISTEDYPAVVYDVDDRLGDRISSYLHVEFIHHDIREPIRERHRYDAVLLDPADGSIALGKWLQRADECLSLVDGSRMYLSANPWRLGRRWAQVVAECLHHGLVPCDFHRKLKSYPHDCGKPVETDLWVFERTSIPSKLPHPYLEIEVFR